MYDQITIMQRDRLRQNVATQNIENRNVKR